MGRAGKAVYRRVRRERRAFVRRHAGRVAAVATIWTVLGGLVVWLMPNLYLQGVASGVFAVLVIGVLPMVVWNASGTASKRLGGDAEQFTSQELKPLRRAGWLVIDHVPFGGYDVDHVALGPGRLLVIETKWTSQRLRPESEFLRRAGEQVQQNARKVRLVLRHPSQQVMPVVVVWGPGTVDLPDGTTDLHGVRVVRGLELNAWLRRVAAHAGEGCPDQDQVARLREFVAARDRHERHRRRWLLPVPPRAQHR